MKFGNTLGQEGGYGFMVFIIKQRKKIHDFFIFLLLSLFVICMLLALEKSQGVYLFI